MGFIWAIWASALIVPIAKAETRTFDVKPYINGNIGEIAIVNLDGSTEARLRGFNRPSAVAITHDNSIFLADSGARDITLITAAGEQYIVSYTWRMAEGASEPVGIIPELNRSILVIDRSGLITKIDANSNVQWTAKAPDSTCIFTSATALQDTRLLIARADARSPETSVLIFDSRDLSWTDLIVGQMPGEEILTPRYVTSIGDHVFLWRPGNSTVLRGTIEGKTFTPHKAFHTNGAFLVAPSNSGGIIYSTFDGAITLISESEQVLGSFQFVNQPVAIGFTPDYRKLVFTHSFPQSLSWPEIEDKLFSHEKVNFNWRSFFIWTTLSLLATIAWLIHTLLRARPHLQGVLALHTTTLHRSFSGSSSHYLWRGSALIAVAYGIYFIVTSHHKLMAGEPREKWLAGYLIGAFIVAISTEIWRHIFPRHEEPERFAKMIHRPAPSFSFSNIAPLVAIGCISFYLYTLGINRAHIGRREGVFCAGIIIALGIVIRETIECRNSIYTFMRNESKFFAPPILVGVITFFYKLTDIPYNCHFDFTLNSFFAGQFLKGKILGGWDWGYVPAPMLGTIPEMVGLLLGGWTPLGYRLGNSLFNITSIFAVYLLGRVYQNQRVGCLAALILAGNVPFIHFGRLQSNGSAATTALWALTMFALALKHKRTSLWLLTGLVCGFSFYQWPVARVGLTAVGCFYLLVLIRYPIAQFKQLPHLLAGILGFALMLAPFIIMWQTYPERLMPRAADSMTGIRWEGTWFRAAAEHPTIQLFYRSLGWIFNEVDRSSQGTLSPGFNSIEAVLFACGLAILVIEGLSINLLLCMLMTITLLVCGAWAVGPPWYTRVLPTAPIACVIIARALDGIYNVLGFGSQRLGRGVFALLGCCLVFISPYTNFSAYVQYESSIGRRYLAHPMVSIARALHKSGPNSRYIWLASGNPLWHFRNVSSFGVMLPYIHELEMKEVYDLEAELKINSGSATTFLVQPTRRAIDIPKIVQIHPEAVTAEIKDINGDVVAITVSVK